MLPIACDSLYCTKEGLKCTGCGTAHYCSPLHQKQAWSLHKKFCRHPERNVVVDGYRVCDAILKANDAVQFSLASKHFGELEFVGADDIVIHSVEEEERVVEVDDEETPSARRQYRLVCTAANYGNLANEDSVRAYWAYRSMASTFTLNSTLFYVLRAYQNAGYKCIVLDDVEIPLRDLEMNTLLVEPRRKVHHAFHQEFKEAAIMVVSVGGYGLDLSAGRFWLFGKELRPLIYCRHQLFGVTVGRFVRDFPQRMTDDYVESMFKNEENVVDGASVFKLAAAQLSLSLADHDACPARFRDVPVRTQQQKLNALALVTSDAFTEVVDRYLEKTHETCGLAHTVNTLGHCAQEAVAQTLMEESEEKK